MGNKNAKLMLVKWPEEHGPNWLCADNVKIGLHDGNVNMDGVEIDDITTIEYEEEQVVLLDLLQKYMELGNPQKIDEALSAAIQIIENQPAPSSRKIYPVDNISLKQGAHRVWTFEIGDNAKATVVLDTRDKSVCGRLHINNEPKPLSSGPEFAAWIREHLGWDVGELHLKKAQKDVYLFHVPRYCDNCEHLSPKEGKQSGDKEPHVCIMLSRQVRHDGFHPQLPTPHDCPK